MGKAASKSAQLSKSDLDQLLKKTNITAKEIKQWHRIYMKECPSGVLSRDQFVSLYTQLSGVPSGMYEHIFRTYDKDNSGEIDFFEFMEAINISRSSKPEDKLRMAFRMYDIDQNGSIEEHEMVEVMKALHSESNPTGKETEALQTIAGNDPSTDERLAARVHKIFTAADQDHDGHVTMEELITACMSNPEVYAMVIASTKK